VGHGYRLLKDDEVLCAWDQTARVSLLLSLEYFEQWSIVSPEAVGQTVLTYIEPDVDRNERVFRRALP
jgi:hypothetical protein